MSQDDFVARISDKGLFSIIHKTHGYGLLEVVENDDSVMACYRHENNTASHGTYAHSYEELYKSLFPFLNKTYGIDRHKEWRKRNPEKVRAKDRRYYHENKEKVNARKDKWIVKNPQYQKDYYESIAKPRRDMLKNEKILSNTASSFLNSSEVSPLDKIVAKTFYRRHGVPSPSNEQLYFKILTQHLKKTIYDKQRSTIDHD